MRIASSSSLRIGNYRRLKSSFSRNSRSSSATHLSLPLSPPSTIFTFARRADRKSIHLRAKSATRNRFRPEPYAARQFPTTIPSRGPRAVSRPPPSSSTPPRGSHPDGRVTCSKNDVAIASGAILHPCRHIALGSREAADERMVEKNYDHVFATHAVAVNLFLLLSPRSQNGRIDYVAITSRQDRETTGEITSRHVRAKLRHEQMEHE